MDQSLEQHLKALLISQEGLRLKPYMDTVGKITIGVGRDLNDRGISNDEAMFLLENDMKIVFENALELSFFKNLDQVRQLVILSMLFNMGLSRFKGFVRMTDALMRSDFSTASLEMRSSRWAREVGLRAVHLSDAMRDGKFS